VLQPKAVKVTLKTVATKELDPQIGLTSPIGVIAIDPNYSGAYSKASSSSLEIDLGFPKPKQRDIAPLPATAPELDKHPLAQAIIAFAEELLNVDHTKQPCLQPTDLKAVITFDVVNKSTTGIGVTILVFKIGEKATVTDEGHQTMELDYDLSGGPVLVPQD
jgi:hypothetical protein